MSDQRTGGQGGARKPQDNGNGNGNGAARASNPWGIALLVTLGAFMEVLDTTIVNVALPHIAGSMSVSNDDATWTLTSYLVANGVVLTISGWLGRVFGRKRYFLICIAMFAVCSLMCGLSTNLPEIIIFRMLQGFFGGGLQPTQQAIILDTFPPAKRGQAFALTAIATIVAPVLGPTLGGWITDNYTWPWIFFINIPIATLTFFGVMALVQDPPQARAQGLKSIDGFGLFLITMGLGCLQIMMDRGEDEDWLASPFILTMAVLAAIGIAGAVCWLLYARNPIVNIRVLGDRTLAISCVLVCAMGSVLYASAVVIPQLGQQVLGYTATLAGLVLSPGAIGLVLLIPLVTISLNYIPTKFILMLGFTCLGTAMIYSSSLTPDVSFSHLVILRMTQAGSLAFIFAPLATIAFTNIKPEDNGDASALFTMFRNVAGSVGISAATAAITNRTQIRMANLAPHMTPLDQGYSYDLQQYKSAIFSIPGHTTAMLDSAATGQLYQTFRTQASVLAYSDIFLFCAVGAFAVVPFTFFLANTTKGKKGSPGAHA